MKSMEKPLKLGKYNKNGDSDEHVQLVNDWVNYFSVDEAFVDTNSSHQTDKELHRIKDEFDRGI